MATSSVPISVTTPHWCQVWPLQGKESQSLALLHPSRRAVSAMLVTSSSPLSPWHVHSRVPSVTSAGPSSNLAWLQPSPATPVCMQGVMAIS